MWEKITYIVFGGTVVVMLGSLVIAEVVDRAGELTR